MTSQSDLYSRSLRAARLKTNWPLELCESSAVFLDRQSTDPFQKLMCKICFLIVCRSCQRKILSSWISSKMQAVVSQKENTFWFENMADTQSLVLVTLKPQHCRFGLWTTAAELRFLSFWTGLKWVFVQKTLKQFNRFLPLCCLENQKIYNFLRLQAKDV